MVESHAATVSQPTGAPCLACGQPAQPERPWRQAVECHACRAERRRLQRQRGYRMTPAQARMIRREATA